MDINPNILYQSIGQKLWHICTVEYYSAIKIHKLFARILKTFYQGKEARSQSLHTVPIQFTCHSIQTKLIFSDRKHIRGCLGPWVGMNYWMGSGTLRCSVSWFWWWLNGHNTFVKMHEIVHSKYAHYIVCNVCIIQLI